MKRLVILPLLLCVALMVHGQNEFHYWFDEDMETMKSGTVDIESKHFDADVSNLINGLHVIYCVIKGYDGATSIKSKAFIKTELGGYTDCTLRYWFDADSLVTSSSIQVAKNIHQLLDVSHLQTGQVHSVNMVVMKGNNLLSSPMTQLFYLSNDPRFNSANTKLCYWLDDDADNVCIGTLTDNGTFFFNIDVSSLGDGEHTISFFLTDGEYLSEIKQALFIKVEATSIGVTSSASSEIQQPIFDLQGRLLLNPNRSGAYIVNGKKVIIK